MITFFICLALFLLIIAGGTYLYLNLFNFWIEVKDKYDRYKERK